MPFTRFGRWATHILKPVVAILFISSALAVSGLGQEPPGLVTALWTAGAPSVWTNAPRWTSNPCAPNNGCGGNTYDVIISVSGVSLNTSPTVNSFTIGPGALKTAGIVTLSVLGTSTNKGSVTLNPRGALHSGTYTQAAIGTLAINISSPALYGRVGVLGAASVAGTLNVGLLGGFVPTIGQTFTILMAGTVTGSFTNNHISINATEHFQVSYTATSVVLTVAAGP
ncbi:MAG TPA: hypothetical protein VG860_03595 [Terriglobia bacterium]|jgi:hypothetical protein|nr:hypothetical protein [Terriglobia bacterium]